MKSEHCTKITKRTNKLYFVSYAYMNLFTRRLSIWEKLSAESKSTLWHKIVTDTPVEREKNESTVGRHTATHFISTLPISVFITSTVIADIWRHGDGVRQGMRWAVRWSNRRQTVKTDYLNPKEMPQSPCVFTSTASMPGQSGTTRVKLWWMLTMDTLVNNFTIYICFLSLKELNWNLSYLKLVFHSNLKPSNNWKFTTRQNRFRTLQGQAAVLWSARLKPADGVACDSACQQLF